MNHAASHAPRTARACAYRLHFPGLGPYARPARVPCDRQGVVDMDTLTEKQRNVYLGARALLGRSYGQPSVEAFDVAS